MTEKKKRQLDEEDFACPECGGQVVTDYEKGERSCEKCGLITDESMVAHNEPEYRVYDDEQKDRIRLGPPSSENMHDRGLSTKIGTSMRDSQGRLLSASSRRDVHRLRKWQYKTRISNSQERNLSYALGEIGQRASQMEISADVEREAIHLYRRSVTENIIRGRSIMAVMAASFYLAGRICNHPMTLDEISKALDVSRKECGRIARFMKRKFDIKLDPPTCDDFLDRFSQRMALTKPTEGRARYLMSICEEAGLYSGKAPMGLVAAVIYIAVDETAKGQVTQREVAERCSVTEVTLRNRCKNIKDMLDGAKGSTKEIGIVEPQA